MKIQLKMGKNERKLNKVSHFLKKNTKIQSDKKYHN